MSSTIRIKRSGTTTSPTTLASGELGYSWASGAGGKLYLGTGTEIVEGQAPNIDVIGGKYFIDTLDHTFGTLTANSALIVDSNLKIDRFFVDNISLDGNLITTTNTNGNLVFSANGTGVIDFSAKRLTNVGAPTVNTDAVTLGYLNNTFSGTLNITGDSGSDAISFLSEALDFNGGTGIATAVTSNTVTFNLVNTAVAAGTYGNAAAVSSFTVDAQGRLTAASNVAIQVTTSQVTALEEFVEDVVGGMVVAANSINITYDDAANTLTFSANDATITTKGVASFATADFNVTAGAVELKDTVLRAITTDSGALTIAAHAVSILGGEGMDVTHASSTITIAGEDANTTNKGIASFADANFTVTSGAVSSKNFTLGSTSLTLGGTSANITGLTTVTVGNLSINGNTISSTDTNGNITLSPNGSGAVSVDSSLIKNVSDPVDPTDAANKQYVDSVAQGLHIHAPCAAATTAPLATITGGTIVYNNGTAGVGATLTVSGGTYGTIDGVNIATVGTRILVKDQANTAHNGIYVYSNTTVITRATDFNTPTEMAGGDFTFVQQGTLYNDTGWVMADPVTTVGTTAVNFIQFSGAGTYTAGDGLALTGTSFSVNVDNSSIEINSDTLRVKALGVTNAMLAGSIANDKLVNSTITIAAESGSADPVSLGQTITFAAGEGIDTVVSNNTITISGEDATDTNKGIASFSSADFVVSSGAVSLNQESIQDRIANTVVAGQAITITYNDAGNTITFAANLATLTTVGVASFGGWTNSANTVRQFSVTSGDVRIINLDGGSF